MKDSLFAVLGVVFAIGAIAFFYIFQSQGEESSMLFMILGAVFVLLTVVCGVMFMSKRVNKAEEIHITE